MVESVASILFVLLWGVPISVLLFGMCWWLYRIMSIYLPVDDVLFAYKFKKLKEQIKAKGIDFDEMMQEFNDMRTIFKTNKKKGLLEKIDNEIDGELDDEPTKAKAK